VSPKQQVVSTGSPEAGKPPVIREPVEPPEAARIVERPAKTASGDARPIYRVGGEVSRPQRLDHSEIDFSRLRDVLIKGVPVLEMVISEKGTVENVRMLRPTDPKLDAVLLKTVTQWRFRPAMKDGRPVPVYYVVTFNFCPQ
jgi:TonB family protein